MKLREPIQRYEVGKHGSEYLVYPSLAMLCPECQSTNVREVKTDDGSCSGDYICADCGCEFDTWLGSELTDFGKFMDKLAKAMAIIFFVSAGVCLIAGLFYVLYLDHTYGNGNVPDDLINIGLSVTVGGPLLFVILASIFCAINEKI
jgi:hypothetical protein